MYQISLKPTDSLPICDMVQIHNPFNGAKPSLSFIQDSGLITGNHCYMLTGNLCQSSVFRSACVRKGRGLCQRLCTNSDINASYFPVSDIYDCSV